MRSQLLRSAAHRVASRVDRAFVEAVITPSARTRRRDPAESLPPVERIFRLSAIEAFYGQSRFLAPDGGFFSRPQGIAPNERRVRRLKGGGQVVDLSWDSGFVPLWTGQLVAERLQTMLAAGEIPDPMLGRFRQLLAEVEDPKGRIGPLRERYLAVRRNRTAHARWFRHGDRARPTVMVVHGHMGGFMPMEERLWPIGKLYEGGMDVVLPMLPLHGRRTDLRRGLRPPDFPASDPRRTIEGFRHLVHDFMGLTDYLLDGRATSLGLAGMSLGGQSVGLLATLDPRFSFAMMLVPLACIADFAHRNGRLVGGPDEQVAQADALRQAQRVISPLARPPMIAGDRVLVVDGRADQVTGAEHSARLIQHFGAQGGSFDGGHLLQFGRAAAFDPLWTLLEQHGLWAPG